MRTITFKPKQYFTKSHLYNFVFSTGTVLDGEMVIDDDPVTQTKIPRYLVYDMINIFKDGKQQEVGQVDFNTRLVAIQREIIDPRDKFAQEGKINKEAEPFRVRLKKFWDITGTKILLGPDFKKEKLGHEPDGLIFQPVEHVSVLIIGDTKNSDAFYNT